MCSEMLAEFGQGTTNGFFINLTDLARDRCRPLFAEYGDKLFECFKQAVGRLIKHQRTGFSGERFQSRLPSFLYRQETLETEPVARESRGNQCRNKGRGTRKALYSDAVFNRLAYQQKSRVGYCRGTRIGYQRHGFAFVKKAYDLGHRFVLIVLVVSKHFPRNAEMFEQWSACPCIFSENEVRFFKHTDSPHSHIFEVADGSGYEVKHFYYFCRYKINKYMLQVNYIRENRDQVVERLTVRNFQALELVDEVIALDERRRQVQTESDATAAAANAAARQIGELMRQGRRDEADAAKMQSGGYKEQQKKLADELAVIEAGLYEKLVRLPNLPHHSVPKGVSADDNEVVLEHGQRPQLPEGALPHWELAARYDIIDFELGTKVTGSGFPVYKGKGARLQRALINFFLDRAEAAGYKEVQPPILINEASGFGTGQLPDKEGQMYYVGIDDLYLIPTAEVPVTNLYRDTIVKESDFPIKHTAYTPCFRREAGSYGAHVRGLNRLHQFDKVEVVQIVHPDKSYTVLEEMSMYVQSLLQALELPYRVLRLCGGDMGFTSALTYDMEVWSAAQQRWLEVSSVSNFEAYQANRLKVRFKGEEGKMQLAHTLNGSALALPRIVASILENNQTAAGIKIPEVLVPYTGFAWVD